MIEGGYRQVLSRKRFNVSQSAGNMEGGKNLNLEVRADLES